MKRKKKHKNVIILSKVRYRFGTKIRNVAINFEAWDQVRLLGLETKHFKQYLTFLSTTSWLTGVLSYT